MKKIAFIKIGTFSGKNDFVLKFFEEYFPNVDVEIVDIWKDLVPYVSFDNWACALHEYGPRVLWNNYATAVLRTNHLFEKVRRSLSRRLNPSDFLFSFQTGSFFDCSLEDVPHFVYTDASQAGITRQFSLAREPLGAFMWHEIFQSAKPGWIERIRKEIAMDIQIDFVHNPHKFAREKIIYDRAARIFAMSDYNRQVLIDDYRCAVDKVVCVYSGAHIRPGEVDPPRPYERKNILFIGSEWERKGGPELAAAFIKVKDVHPQASLTVIGCSPPLRIDRCRVLGKLSPEEVAQHYRQASVFCVPSRVEAFGNVFIEAQYFKLPVVTTRTGALPEIVAEGRSGTLVPPRDSGALAAALIDLLNNPQRCVEWGQAGEMLMRQRYAWKETGTKMFECIQQSLNAKIDFPDPVSER